MSSPLQDLKILASTSLHHPIGVGTEWTGYEGGKINFAREKFGWLGHALSRKQKSAEIKMALPMKICFDRSFCNI